jgi:hypothetical protein
MSTITIDPHRAAVVGWRPTVPPSEELRRAALDRLDPLLAEAAALELDDAPGWARLRAVAHATTAVLTAAELLPHHLRVRHGDPPVVIARTLANAWRWVGAS